MKCRLADYPTRFYVTSRTEEGVEYLVDLCAFPVTVDGVRVFNGSCGVRGAPETMCNDFRYRCQKTMKIPGKICRCAHIIFARENCIDFMLPRMAEADPNRHESFQS